jgi:hypothetical protein
MIKKHGNKFVVTNKAGTKVLGTHPSKEKAAKQLAAIEISKAQHMSENTKRFKNFRNELNESEYKETLTGYPNRGIDTDVGPANANLLMKANAVLNSLNRFTHQHTNDAMIKIRTRLNLFMLDFSWTPWMWQSNMTGTFAVPVTLYGRVDGVDAFTGGIDFKGTANPTAGLQKFILSVSVETAEDGLYRVNAKLQPQEEAILPEGVEEDGDAVTEDYQTSARAREIANKIEKHETKAQSGYAAKITQSGKAAARGRRQEDKHDAASRRLMKRDEKEQDSPRTYGRGGKLIKRGSRAEVQEEMEQIDELSKGTKDAYLAKRGSQLSSMLWAGRAGARGHLRGKQLTGRQQANAVKGIKRATGVKEENEVSEQWKSLKKTKADLNAIRASGKKVSVQHGEGDTLYRVSKPKKSVKEEAEQIDEKKKMKTWSPRLDKLMNNRDKVYAKTPAWLKRQKERNEVKEEAEQIEEAGQAKLARLGKSYDRARIGARGVLNPENKKRLGDAYFKMRDKVLDKRKKRIESGTFDKEAEVKAVVAKNKGTFSKVFGKKTVKEELVGGQKRLDVNKNKKLDSQDFKLLRSKKKAAPGSIKEGVLTKSLHRLGKRLRGPATKLSSSNKKLRPLEKSSYGEWDSQTRLRMVREGSAPISSREAVRGQRWARRQLRQPENSRSSGMSDAELHSQLAITGEVIGGSRIKNKNRQKSSE